MNVKRRIKTLKHNISIQESHIAYYKHFEKNNTGSLLIEVCEKAKKEFETELKKLEEELQGI